MKEIEKFNINPSTNLIDVISSEYSFNSAIADLIDNCLDGKADVIKLLFEPSSGSYDLHIIDNGNGMTQEELSDAMKYGSTLKGKKRSDDDLGRFGMGLKSASHSQCRRLSVVSKKNDTISAYVWDLDIIDEEHDWMIIDCSEDEIAEIPFVKYLDNKKTGTVVVWQDFDFIRKEAGEEFGELVRQQNDVANYLSLIFHRYLSKEKKERLLIRINNFQLEPLDPFLENHPKTSVKKSISIPVKDSSGIERKISIQPYILPFILH